MGATELDAAGATAVGAREGLRLEAYLDSVGVPTVGIGHTGRASPPKVHLGMRVTTQQAYDFFKTDSAPVADVVRGIVGDHATQNQFNALVSLGFNIGATGLKNSTVAAKFRAGDLQGAADAFMMWVHPPELRGRRQQERAQFLRPDSAPGQAHPSLDSPLSLVVDVKSLQALLQVTGDYAGQVDGDFGPGTLAAVVKFQTRHGLDADGVVGPKTYDAMDSEVAERDAAKAAAAAAPARPATHEDVGTSHDPGATAHELQGRQPASLLRRLWAAVPGGR